MANEKHEEKVVRNLKKRRKTLRAQRKGFIDKKKEKEGADPHWAGSFKYLLTKTNLKFFLKNIFQRFKILLIF